MNDASNKSLQVGTVLNNKWVILEFIAKGAMGEVYRAHQLNLKREIAIKVVSPEWLRCLDDDEEEIETTFHRFRREVEAMAKIRHPNVLQIFDYDSASIKRGAEDISLEYIAMEYVSGNSLRSTMSEDGFYPDDKATRDWLVDYFLPVLDGVQAMHEAGIVHRDLKPENVLLDGNTPKIADFGLARSCRLKTVTQSIDAKGTPPYMSPEHFFDFRRADEKADIYSLGKILFEAIDGKITPKTVPFQSAALENQETPFFKDIDRIIRSATAEDKKERIGSVTDFRKALEETISSLERTPSAASVSTQSYSAFARPKWIWTGIAVAVISVALMTIWHLVGEPGKSRIGWKWLSVDRSELTEESPSPPSEPVLPSTTPPARSFLAEDAVTLHFVPGGTITIPDNFGSQSKKQVKVAPFYMDETPVTNHQYVNFLNQDLSRIQVEKGVVKSNGEIWLLLGEVLEGYEPIVFENARFRIKKSSDAACPVLRVTPYGASAYARTYGRRLPSDVEWLYAVKRGALIRDELTADSQQSPGIMMEGESMHHGLMDDRGSAISSQQPKRSRIPLPVELSAPNAYGIRGLNKDMGEWGIRKNHLKSMEAEYVILGGFGGESEAAIAVSRQPWEAFEEVGFRCVQSASTHN